MFGLSIGEIFILLVVGIVVVGPKNLPSLMRTAGQWIGKLRRMSTDLRSQSGIDELIRQEGLEREIQEIRSLSRVNVIDTIMSPVVAPAVGTSTFEPASAPARRPLEQRMRSQPLREREYPVLGCDAYDAMPEDASPYLPPPPDHPEDDAPEAAGDSPAAVEDDDPHIEVTPLREDDEAIADARSSS